MQDIATATGAKYFSEQTGDNLQMLSMDDLGRAEKVISGRFNTLVFGPGGDVEARTQELQEQLNVETSPHEKDFLKERVANLGGGVAVIYVGAQSDIEQKEKKDRVDDAVCAVRAALEQGILPGGGVALKDVALKMSTDSKGSEILSYAMLSPMAKILDNAGIDYYTEVASSLDGEGIGMDVSDMSVRNMMEAGIIDPTKVTKEALKNAVSVATTLLGTHTIITNVRG
jgi:chaperonin GroEL